MPEKIKRVKLSEKYILNNGNYHMEVEVTRDLKKKKRLRILNQSGKEFVFIGSKPEVVKAIGELLVEASKL